MELWEHQERGISEYFNGKKMLSYDIGLGKTRMALGIFKVVKGNKTDARCLVLSPISAMPTWKAEIESCGMNRNDIDIMSYEMFLRRDNDYKQYEVVIFDEIHKFKSARAKRTKKALKVFNTTPYKVGLTGTAVTKHYDIYSQVNVLDTKLWQGHGIYSYRQFLGSFFHCHPQFHYPLGMVRGGLSRLQEMTEPIILTMKRDTAKLPDIQYIDSEFPMVMPSLKDLIGLGDFQKTLILAGGFNADAGSEPYEDSKVNYILDKLEESDENAIIFCRFLHEVNYLKKKIGDCYIVTGSNKRHLQEATEKQDKTIVATYCLKEGTNLQGYNQLFFYSIPTSYRDYTQTVGRIYRSGQQRKVVVYNLLGGWIDKHIMGLLRKGENALSTFMRRFSNGQ